MDEFDFSFLDLIFLEIVQEFNTLSTNTVFLPSVFHIADHEEIVVGKRREQRILHAVGVLVFIHQNLAEVLADSPGKLRGRLGTAGQSGILKNF